MTLTDTGPLIARVNRNDPHHAACASAIAHLSGPLLTTWPCLVEAMHIVHRRGGHPARRNLWALRQSGQLDLHAPTDDEVGRMAELMDRYQDLPMDLADASLIAVAERLAIKSLFTLDEHFRIYRLADGTALKLVP